ncbi:MAG: hypothetical protein CO109_00520 [Deltaproteobacteria bacterium CG_4_9_14_3_um_filter_65_9]|nr:MAG: hypothetical protein CO109_00520 [Deltaproteobacteria bacterium CG_4_9_14_3_um_filter_65_9]
MMPKLSGMSTRALWTLLAILFTICLFPPIPSPAEELSVLAGMTESVDSGGMSPSWEVMFRHNFLRNFAASLSWINEGRLEEHSRDGIAAQGWGRVPLLDNRLSIGVGAGIYNYFDTVQQQEGGHKNVHGWVPVYSLSATYYPREPWFAQVAVNHIHPGGDFRSDTFLAGVGYRLWKEADTPSGRRERDPVWTTGYEVAPFLGQVVLNRPDNDPGIGSGIEFRMGIDEHLDWTATWLNEDVPRTFHRTGLGTQIWLVDAFLARRITLGFGAGLYSFVDREPTPDSAENERLDIAGLLTVTASYRFSDRWFTRFNWNRVMSNDSRDSDNFLLGLGYRWGRRSGDE